MAVITYIATRQLTAGTAFNQEKQIENRFHAMPRTSEPVVDQRVSLDGTPEGYLHRIDEQYDITTDYLTVADMLLWREFFASVANTEVFELDLTGTIADPDESIDVWMPRQRVQESEVSGPIRQLRFFVRRRP